MDLKEAAAIGSALTQLPVRFICAWWYAENGETWPVNNNPGNVSYTGSGVPSSGVFAGVTEVNPDNQVCVYDSPESGIRAWALTINTPVGLKYLDIDTAMLLGKDVQEQCRIVGNSNWAAGHYMGVEGWAGSSIWDAYHNTVIDAWFTPPIATHETVKPSRYPYQAVTVREGQTVWGIALDHQIPVDVLAAFNALTHPAIIHPGENILIPLRYRVKAGDTLDAIGARFARSATLLADVNRINPNVIYSGQSIWV